MLKFIKPAGRPAFLKINFMKTKYDWNEIDRITGGKAKWAANYNGKLLAFDEKPEWDEHEGWMVYLTSKTWIIKKWIKMTAIRNYNWKKTLEQRPEQD